MKFLTLTIASILTIAISYSTVASAHVLEVDGTIGAVLHIPPDDSPRAGVETTYVLTISDDKRLFDLPKCDCTLTILDTNDRIQKTLPMGPGSSTVSYTKTTIDAAGTYILRFSGTPRDGGSFQPFTLDYTVRLSDGQLHAQSVPILLWVGIGMVVVLILLGASISWYS